jgi:hypothetical protein
VCIYIQCAIIKDMTYNRRSKKNLKEKYLDGERLFRKYWEMGESRSVRLLTEWAIIEGMKSSSGVEPTHMGCWKSMWRWASLKGNRERAWEIYKENVINANFGEWKLMMIRVRIPTAWQYPKIKLNKFLRENGWTE